MNINEYEKQAEDFLKETNTTFRAVWIEHGLYFDDDIQTRDIYRIILTREGKKALDLRFGQSIAKSGTLKAHYVLTQQAIRDGRILLTNKDYLQKRTAPTAYDVLACVTKYDPGSFENFCQEYGYNTDSRQAERMYFDVVREYREVKRIWTEEEIEKLREIY